MDNIICYINNIPMTSTQLKLFDKYKKYIDGKTTNNDFINFEGYGNTFEKAKEIYEKVMGFELLIKNLRKSINF